MARLFSGKGGAHPHDIAGKGEAARVTLMLAPDLASLFQEALIANIRLLLRGVEMAVLQEEVITRVAGFSSWKTGVASKPDEKKAKVDSLNTLPYKFIVSNEKIHDQIIEITSKQG